MTLPKEYKDLSLAPVAAAIDFNLQRLRERTPEEIYYDVSLELNRPHIADDPKERAECVLAVALRDVELHGWTATISDDNARLHLAGGSVAIDLGLSATLLRYIAEGAEKAVSPVAATAG
jgi:acetyl-CoA acetyltransferase